MSEHINSLRLSLRESSDRQVPAVPGVTFMVTPGQPVILLFLIYCLLYIIFVTYNSITHCDHKTFSMFILLSSIDLTILDILNNP